MHSAHRPSRRDWAAGVAAGAGLGFVILGIGARAGMRLIALDIGQAPLFTVEGSIAVSLMGAAAGAIVAAIFLLLRTVLPTHRFVRAAIFWAICLALVLRGISPITVVNASIFVPLFLLHGALLHVFWCRIYPRRALNE